MESRYTSSAPCFNLYGETQRASNTHQLSCDEARDVCRSCREPGVSRRSCMTHAASENVWRELTANTHFNINELSHNDAKVPSAQRENGVGARERTGPG